MDVNLVNSVKLNKLKNILKLFSGAGKKQVKLSVDGNMYDIDSIYDTDEIVCFVARKMVKK